MSKPSKRLRQAQGGEFFESGVKAAKDGMLAADCPYPTSANRKEWLAGFFSVRPPVNDSQVSRAKSL